MTNVDGVVHVVFATMALGMGIDCVGLTQTIHYGAPRSIDDYFQECGRAGRACSHLRSDRPDRCFTPNLFLSFENLLCVRPFVKASASMSFVGLNSMVL